MVMRVKGVGCVEDVKRNQRIKKLCDRGVPLKDIAEKYRISAGRVWQLRNRMERRRLEQEQNKMKVITEVVRVRNYYVDGDGVDVKITTPQPADDATEAEREIFFKERQGRFDIYGSIHVASLEEAMAKWPIGKILHLTVDE
jgi:hypothetical protein